MKRCLAILAFAALASCAEKPQVVAPPPEPAAVLTQAPSPEQPGYFKLTGSFTQGGLVTGIAEPGAKVALDGRALWVTPEGKFLFGLPREAGDTVVLSATRPDGEMLQQTLTVAPRTFRIERVDGVPDNTVDIPEHLQARRNGELSRVAAAKAEKSWRKAWEQPFIWPAKGRISGAYGSQRVLNGKPKNPHWGVDVAAPTGTPVIAPQGGKVTFAEEGLLLEGGLIMIDHGYGLSSSFLHLSRVDVKAGDEVKQGDPIGAIGATGRASGPHLDWRMSWWEVRVDPQLLVPAMTSDAR